MDRYRIRLAPTSEEVELIIRSLEHSRRALVAGLESRDDDKTAADMRGTIADLDALTMELKRCRLEG